MTFSFCPFVEKVVLLRESLRELLGNYFELKITHIMLCRKVHYLKAKDVVLNVLLMPYFFASILTHTRIILRHSTKSNSSEMTFYF